MGATASTILKVRLMDGSETDWGTKTNTSLGILENAIAGTTSISTTGGTTTLTNVDYTDDQAKKATLDVSGALTTNAIIEIPNTSRMYRVFNRTTEAGSSTTLTIKTSGGTGILVPRSTVCTVYCNGSNTMRYVTPISDYTTGAPATSSGAAASSVSVTAAGNLSSTNVQSALTELQGDVDTINSTLTSSYQPLNAKLTAVSGLGVSKGNVIAGDGSTFSTLAVGTDAYVMTADAASATGLKWSPITLPSGTYPDLLAIEALGTTGILKRTGSNTWALGTADVTDLANTTANRLFGTNGSGVSGVVTLSAPMSLSGSALSVDLATTSAAGVVQQADKAAMEARTGNRAVRPDLQQHHPGHPKAWGSVTVSGGTPSLNANYNVTSVTKNSNGNFTVTLATNMSSTAYCIVGNGGFGTTGGSAGNGMVISFTDLAVGSFRLLTMDNNADSLSDAAFFTFVVLGDQ